MKNKPLILWLKEVDPEETELIGPKAAGLAEMRGLGLNLPNGFVVTTAAYLRFLQTAGLYPQIKAYWQGLDFRDPRSLQTCSQRIQKLILNSKLAEEIAQLIMKSYLRLGGLFKEVLVAVRSSAINEDLKTASFLNLKGEANVVEAIKKCWASVFCPENLSKGPLWEEGVAVVVQQMVQSRVSGVIYSTSPKKKKELVVKAVYGLGELASQGKVTPDRYYLNKVSLKLLRRRVSSQEFQLIKSGTANKKVRVSKARQGLAKLAEQEVISLAKLAKKIQGHYFFPQEIEFAIEKNKTYILQTGPIATGKIEKTKKKKKIDQPKLETIVEGKPASPGIASGYVRVVKNAREIKKIKQGEIVVASAVGVDFLPVMRKISGLIIEQADPLAYGAMLARELGFPCVVAAQRATKTIRSGVVITLNGGTGKVYQGAWQRERKMLDYQSVFSPSQKPAQVEKLLKTATKIYVNLHNPQLVELVAQNAVDGVLFQPEFLVSQLNIHPKKLMADKNQDKLLKKLTEGLGQVCQVFPSQPVIYKLLNLTSDEYRHLIGGEAFEPQETNPLLGFHGAARYLVETKLLDIQLKALAEIRQTGVKNLGLMIPFVRTPREVQAVKKIISSQGLIRGPSFKLWLMLEVPANIFLLAELVAVGVDGICLKLPELLTLTFAVDEKNQEVFSQLDPHDLMVEEVFEKILRIKKKYNLMSLVCTQERFLYSDLVKWTVESGINGVCINPDAVWQARELIYQEERRLAK